MKIISVASEIPETVETNDTLETRLSLDKGWIEKRTGVLRRPIASPSDATSDLAVRAGAAALKRINLDGAFEAKDTGLLLLATSTPDHLLPPTAPLVAHRLGLSSVGAIDLTGACAGFLYAMILGNAYGQSMRKPVVIIGANILSRRVNSDDPSTASLFSDGAGCAILAPAEPTQFLGSWLGSDGSSYDVIGIPAGGSREPLTATAVSEGRNLMTMRRGTALFKHAVHAMVQAGEESMKATGIRATDVDWWIPHQANTRIIQDTGKLLGIPPERAVNVVAKYGNSSAATIPIALAEGMESGRIRPGNTLLFTAAGAGMLSAGLVVQL